MTVDRQRRSRPRLAVTLACLMVLAALAVAVAELAIESRIADSVATDSVTGSGGIGAPASKPTAQ